MDNTLYLDTASLQRPSEFTGKRSADIGRMRDGQEYDVVLLGPGHAAQNFALQGIVYDGLQNKSWLSFRRREEFEACASKGHIMVGAVHQGRLVGQSLVVMPSERYPDTGVYGMPLEAAPQEQAIISSAIVHPDYRGNRIQKVMTKAALALAHAAGRKHMVSDVCIDNYGSWMSFVDKGLSIHSVGADPSISPNTVYFLHAELGPLMRGELREAFNKASPAHVPFDALDRQRELLEQGFRGVIYDGAEQTIGFKRAGDSGLQARPGSMFPSAFAPGGAGG